MKNGKTICALTHNALQPKRIPLVRTRRPSQSHFRMPNITRCSVLPPSISSPTCGVVVWIQPKNAVRRKSRIPHTHMKNCNPRKKRHNKQAAYEHCRQSCLDCLQKHPGGGIHITSGSSPVMPRWTNCKTAHPTKPEQCHKQNSFTTANSSLDCRIPHELRLLGGPKQARTHTKIHQPREKRLNQQAASGNRLQSCLDSLRKRPDGGVHKHLWLFTLIPRPGPQTPTTAKLPTQQNQSDVANPAHLKRQILAWVPESHMGAAAGASAPRQSPQGSP